MPKTDGRLTPAWTFEGGKRKASADTHPGGKSVRLVLRSSTQRSRIRTHFTNCWRRPRAEVVSTADVENERFPSA